MRSTEFPQSWPTLSPSLSTCQGRQPPARTVTAYPSSWSPGHRTVIPQSTSSRFFRKTTSLHDIAFAMDALALRLDAIRSTGRMAAPAGCSMRDFLGFLFGAAVASACVVLLQPAAPCPCGLFAPADCQQLVTLWNGTAHSPPCPCGYVAPADHQELATLGNGTAHGDPSTRTTKPSDMVRG